MRRALVCAFSLGLLAASLRGDAPPGYYDSTAGLAGSALKNALHEIIDDHIVIPYDDLFPALYVLWEDSGNPSNVRLIYGGVSVAKSSFSWNREHLWPRSRGVEDTGADTSDLFHIVPCDDDVNSERSNLYFDNSSALDGSIISPGHPEAPLTSRDSNSWEPPPLEKGDIARALFYMAVRYDGSDSLTTDLELVSGTPSGPQMARLDMLLQWHQADPPDAVERARNDRVFTDYQHNRNPFIDHPEWVSSVWGGGSTGTVAQAIVTDANATESPMTTGALAVQLSTAAGPGGLTVFFSVSGTAQPGEFTLSGPGVSFNPATATGSMTIPAGATVGTLTLSPITDGVEENAETMTLSLTNGGGYTVGGNPANITITDSPPVPPPGGLATWTFDAASFPNPLPSDTGAASLDSSGWAGFVRSFSGVSGQSYVLEGMQGNGSHIDFRCSTLGTGNLSVAFQTRGTATGFNVGSWSWSIDGSTFTTLAGVNTATRDSAFSPRTVDFASVPALNHAASVTFRYTLSGATSDLANNRIDNFAINASPLPMVSIATSGNSVKEGSATPVTLTVTSSLPASAGGLSISVAIGGTAIAGTDYLLTGVTAFDSTTGLATISIPAGATTAAVHLAAINDANPLEFDEMITGQVVINAARKYIRASQSPVEVTLKDKTPYNSAWAARFPAFQTQLVNPMDDPDQDGRTNLEEFAADSDPLSVESAPDTSVEIGYFRDPNAGNVFKPFLAFSFVRRIDENAPTYTPQSTADFISWQNDLVLVASSLLPGFATERATFRSAAALDSASNPGGQFLRLRIDSAP